jgi:dTDP-4-amino-4,6-dideoxygalactose transaminase
MANATIPLNDLSRYASQMAEALSGRATAVITGGRYVLGPLVAEFEDAFARYCGVDHCVGVANGTDALELALRGCGVEPGDAVITCANAAMYGTSAILALGARPVFADVDHDGLLTADSIRVALAGIAAPPRAVLVTHLYGRMADMQPIAELTRPLGMTLLEDCAQAHGACTADGLRAGACGDAAAFSFYPTKNLGALGDAGAVVTSDSRIAARVRQLRQYGWSNKYENALPGGRNSRLDELQAAFLGELLPDLDRRNRCRIKIAARYSARINHPGIRVPTVPEHGFVAHLYVIRCQAREELASHLARMGVDTAIHYPTPDFRQPVMANQGARTSLPMTEAACAEVLSLPCFPELTEAECDEVIAACNGWEPQ